MRLRLSSGVFLAGLLMGCVSNFGRAQAQSVAGDSAVKEPMSFSTTADDAKPHLMLRSFPANVLQDQQAFLTSPFRIRASQVPLLLMGTAFGVAMIASDTAAEARMPKGATTVKLAANLSDAGMGGLLAASGGLFLWGQQTRNEQMRETGFLAGEAAVDAYMDSIAFKYVAGRQRPYTGNGRGEFLQGGDSFPSSTSAVSWAAASVIAHEYPGPLTKLFAYGTAEAVDLGRVIGQKHWPSDTLIGSALGWYLGRQVYRARSSDAGIDTANWGTFERSVKSNDPPDNLEPWNNGYSSTYIPLDSWIYPALLRLYSLGYLDTAFIDMRPWTWLQVAAMLHRSEESILSDNHNSQAREIFFAVERELRGNGDLSVAQWETPTLQLESVYTQALGISGAPLNDGFHLGQTLVNDYGRPYQEGFNDYTGFSLRAQSGQFSTYFRGEYQHAPGATGYSPAVAAILGNIDGTTGPSPLIPLGPIAPANQFTVLAAYASMHMAGSEWSFGRSEEWLGPGVGGAMAWSNNALPIYSFRINRVEPLYLPGLSRLLGPLRYDFLVGPLQGHTVPNAPWVHAEQFSFKPTENFSFGFERTVIWGGAGHEPITLDSFFRSFFSFNDVTNNAVKFGRTDPGARFSAFNFSWRLPFLRRWATLYTDSEVHDDVSPVSAPRRSAFRPGLYLSHFPGLPRLDFRIEGADTDPQIQGLTPGGRFLYWEIVQRQGYTNGGSLFGDWIGRDAKGGQAWLTWHLNGNEWIQLSYRNAKAVNSFIPGGTTQNDFTAGVVKRLAPALELNAWVQWEQWKAPLIASGLQKDVAISAQLTWYPKISVHN
jgi:membrane-associated phospholipid phosphatase